MGTDIHGYVEIKPYAKVDINTWYAIIDIGMVATRHYCIFGKLFGVRITEEEPIAAFRGLPKDMSDKVRQDPWQKSGDVHSHSWVSLKEINAVDWEAWDKAISAEYGPTNWNNPDAKFADSEYGVLFQMMNLLGKLYGEDNVRLVVWFDC